jgi:ribose 5-phosphate isomerase B
MMISSKAPVIMGCDHAAFSLKEEIKAWLENNRIDVEDVGTHDEGSVDYPDFAIKVAKKISTREFERGILICGTGIGMSMAANKFENVRAALCTDLFSSMMSRRHNDANVLVLGARVTGPGLALEIVKAWLETPFEGGRHQMRLDKFNSLGKAPLC